MAFGNNFGGLSGASGSLGGSSRTPFTNRMMSMPTSGSRSGASSYGGGAGSISGYAKPISRSESAKHTRRAWKFAEESRRRQRDLWRLQDLRQPGLRRFMSSPRWITY